MRRRFYSLAAAMGVAALVLLLGSGTTESTLDVSGPVVHEQAQVIPMPVIVPMYAPIIVNRSDADLIHEYRVTEVYYGMVGIASTEYPYDVGKLMKRWDKSPGFAWVLATWFVEIADKYGLDPFDLMAMTWHESRWNVNVEGDCKCIRHGTTVGEKTPRGKRGCQSVGGFWKCVSCGIMQANMGKRGEKWGMSCQQAKMDPYKLIDRGARMLASFRQDDGLLPLFRYNCPACKQKITKYEWQIRRTAELGRHHAHIRMNLRSEALAAGERIREFLPFL